MKRKNSASLPFDENVELSVIGTALTNRQAMEWVSTNLESGDFFCEEAEMVYEACLALRDRGEEVGEESALRELTRQGKLEEMGDARFVHRAVEACDAVLFSSNVSTLRNLSALRLLLSIGNRLCTAASGFDADPAAILQDLETAISQVRSKMVGLKPRIVGLHVLQSNPRRYEMKLSDGRKVPISLDELLNPDKLRKAIINALDFVPALPKDWRAFVAQLLARADKEPADADEDREVLDEITNYFDIRGEARAASDLATGSYVKHMIGGRQYYLFQKMPILALINSHLNRKINTADLWQLVHGWGGKRLGDDGKPISKSIGGSTRNWLWALPKDVFEHGAITEDDEADEIGSTAKGQIDVGRME